MHVISGVYHVLEPTVDQRMVFPVAAKECRPLQNAARKTTPVEFGVFDTSMCCLILTHSESPADHRDEEDQSSRHTFVDPPRNFLFSFSSCKRQYDVMLSTGRCWPLYDICWQAPFRDAYTLVPHPVRGTLYHRAVSSLLLLPHFYPNAKLLVLPNPIERDVMNVCKHAFGNWCGGKCGGAFM